MYWWCRPHTFLCTAQVIRRYLGRSTFNEVDGSTLLELTQADMIDDLGLKRMHTHKLLNAISRLKSGSFPSAQPAAAARDQVASAPSSGKLNAALIHYDNLLATLLLFCSPETPCGYYFSNHVK